MLRAEISIRMEQSEGEAVLVALQPEMAERKFSDSVAMSYENGSLQLTVEARDAGDLRAALNSYLRWIEMARRIYAMEESK